MNNEASPAELYPGSPKPEEMAAIYYDGNHDPTESDSEPHELWPAWPDITSTWQDTIVSDKSGKAYE